MLSGNTNIFAISKQDTSVMKGIAIIAMLCHHVYTWQPEWVEAYPFFLTTLGVLGKVCVAIFLFFSGYGLAVQYVCLLISIVLEYAKEKIQWNRLTNKIILVIDKLC